MSVLALPAHCARSTWSEFRQFVLGYLELIVAYWRAQERRVDPGDNPVPLARLRRWGVRNTVLLWMYYRAHIEQREPLWNPSTGGQEWIVRGSTRIDEGSYFVLTRPGEAFADLFLARVVAPLTDHDIDDAWATLLLGQLAPQYNRAGRVFRWGNHVLKHFRQPSPNQELILSAAEELDWPVWFDDPLPRGMVRNAKVRLHDTIKDLNRRQRIFLIHFMGDGTGTRLGWELR